MAAFLSDFALALIAALFLISGTSHAFVWRGFRQTIRAHRVFPRQLTGWIATGVCAFELMEGGCALLGLGSSAARFRSIVLLLALAAGIGFWLYLFHVVVRKKAAGTCGCSILDAPLSIGSLAPSSGIIAFALIGIVGTLVSGAEPGIQTVFALLWGITWAGLLLLYPAAIFRFNERK